MEPTDLQRVAALESSLLKNPKDWGKITELLALLRRTRARRSDLVVKYAQPLLAAKGGSSAVVWDTREQLFLAALDIHNLDLARVQSFCKSSLTFL